MYLNKSLIVEKYRPYLISVIALIIWELCHIEFPDENALLSLLSSTLTLSGILIGFLATNKAILISMNSPIIESLKESGYITELVQYISHAINSNIIFCIINILGYFLDVGSYYPYLWLFFLTLSIFSFLRVTNISLKLLKYN